MIAWHPAAGNTINIQVDDGPVNTTSYSSGATNTNQPLTVGAYSDESSALDGRVDEVALYKRVLTAAERTWLYNNGNGRTYSDLTASTSGWYTNGYAYTGDQPHAVTSINRVNFTDTFTYDANGNMTCRVESGITYLQTYNTENRIASIAKLASGS